MPDTGRLGVMTADEFKNRTKATKDVCGFSSHFKSRGSSMAGIDSALAFYDWVNVSKDSDYNRLGALLSITYACEAYLKDKAAKPSALSGHRKQVVADLLKSVDTATAYVKTRMKGTAKAKAGARPTKALEPGYKHERDQYRQVGKQQNPYSASAMHDGGPDPATIDLNQFISAGSGSSIQRVEFLNRAQRLEHLVVIKEGTFYQNSELLKCDAGAGVIFSRTYVFDHYGNLFSKQEARSSSPNVRFNHSSYCAGKEVLCAGTLAAHNGKLVYMTNLSGHYKPDVNALALVLILLGEEGVNLDDVAVNARGVVNGWCKGSTFVVHKGGSPADWPHKIDRGAYGIQWRLQIGGQDTRVSDPT